jgi:hypothetical protein
MQMMEALIQANKQFDSQIYPDKNHGIYGGNTRIQLYNKMTNFIKENFNSINGQQNSNVRRNCNFEGKTPKQLWYLFLVEMWELLLLLWNAGYLPFYGR